MKQRYLPLVSIGLAGCAAAPHSTPAQVANGPREVSLAQLARAASMRGQATYRIGGSPALQPTRVSDDGRVMMIDWPADADLPAVFAIDGQGHEFLPVTSMRSDRMIIDAIYPRLIFRIDGKTAWARRVITRRAS